MAHILPWFFAVDLKTFAFSLWQKINCQTFSRTFDPVRSDFFQKLNFARERLAVIFRCEGLEWSFTPWSGFRHTVRRPGQFVCPNSDSVCPNNDKKYLMLVTFRFLLLFFAYWWEARLISPFRFVDCPLLASRRDAESKTTPCRHSLGIILAFGHWLVSTQKKSPHKNSVWADPADSTIYLPFFRFVTPPKTRFAKARF
jgi:hypothetical protein